VDQTAKLITLQSVGVLVMRVSWFGLVATTLVTSVAAQQDTVTIQTVPVAPGVSMLVGSGGNIGVSAGDDAVFLVDDQFAPLTP
jgi:hypothetical protein